MTQKRTIKPLGEIHFKILELLKRTEGATLGEIREVLHIVGDQEHLGRRLRELYPHHQVEKLRKGSKFVYRWVKERDAEAWEFSTISKKLRAEVLHEAHGKCLMCGRSISDDGIRLHVDHKIPQEWGGSSSKDNLWAICSVCNEGKQAFFATFDTQTMRRVLGHPSVHRRLLEALRLRPGDWVDSDFLEFVANFDDVQDDWQKRVRELRYFRLEIETDRVKSGRRMLSRYRLLNDVDDLPEDLSSAAREFERKRAARNRGESE